MGFDTLCLLAIRVIEIFAFTVIEQVRFSLSVIRKAADLYGTCSVNSHFCEAHSLISKVSTPPPRGLAADALPSRTEIAFCLRSEIISPEIMIRFC